MPKVSVIIATHSRPQLLPRAVQSAFDAGTDVEVIVVDDASTDETAQVCQTLPGIKYIRVERNQHTAGARNIGIVASTAPYISFLDDDDWRLPGSLDLQVGLLEKNPQYGAVYGKQLFADQAGTILDEPAAPDFPPPDDTFLRLLEGNIMGCLTVVFKKECIYKVGMLDPNYSGVDDWDLWLRIAEFYPFLAIEEPVAVWRKADPKSNQGSSNMANLLYIGAKAYREKWSKLPRVQAAVEASAGKTLNPLRAISDLVIYDTAYSETNKRHKLSRFYRALKIHPSNIGRLYFYKVLLKSLLTS